MNFTHFTEFSAENNKRLLKEKIMKSNQNLWKNKKKISELMTFGIFVCEI